jgi:hypothetical protein
VGLRTLVEADPEMTDGLGRDKQASCFDDRAALPQVAVVMPRLAQLDR